MSDAELHLTAAELNQRGATGLPGQLGLVILQVSAEQVKA